MFALLQYKNRMIVAEGGKEELSFVSIKCNDTVYKVNFKFSLSSIFYIEEMLTIICNSSNGLYFVYCFAVDHSFHCNLDLETCPDLETCLELVLLPNYIDLSYKQ